MGTNDSFPLSGSDPSTAMTFHFDTLDKTGVHDITVTGTTYRNGKQMDSSEMHIRVNIPSPEFRFKEQDGISLDAESGIDRVFSPAYETVHNSHGYRHEIVSTRGVVSGDSVTFNETNRVEDDVILTGRILDSKGQGIGHEDSLRIRLNVTCPSFHFVKRTDSVKGGIGSNTFYLPKYEILNDNGKEYRRVMSCSSYGTVEGEKITFKSDAPLYDVPVTLTGWLEDENGKQVGDKDTMTVTLGMFKYFRINSGVEPLLDGVYEMTSPVSLSKRDDGFNYDDISFNFRRYDDPSKTAYIKLIVKVFYYEEDVKNSRRQCDIISEGILFFMNKDEVWVPAERIDYGKELFPRCDKFDLIGYLSDVHNWQVSNPETGVLSEISFSFDFIASPEG